MLIIIDARMPWPAKARLREYGRVEELATSGVTYDAISGHPDIFICPVPRGIVVAPDLPVHILGLLQKISGLTVITGRGKPGMKYPASAAYNALAGPGIAVYNPTIADPAIQAACQGLDIVPVKQGYTRCNLADLGNDVYITSDRGIFKALNDKNITAFYTDPQDIVLPGMPHGFFGGTCGISGNRLFIAGSLMKYSQAQVVKEAARMAGLEIIELYDGPLFDGGSILFI